MRPRRAQSDSVAVQARRYACSRASVPARCERTAVRCEVVNGIQTAELCIKCLYMHMQRITLTHVACKLLPTTTSNVAARARRDGSAERSQASSATRQAHALHQLCLAHSEQQRCQQRTSPRHMAGLTMKIAALAIGLCDPCSIPGLVRFVTYCA